MKDEALSNDGVNIATFPIAAGLESSVGQFEEAVSKIASLIQDNAATVTVIHDWFRHECGVDKPSRALIEPHKLDADDFVRLFVPSCRRPGNGLPPRLLD
jgi:hypothetical protein